MPKLSLPLRLALLVAGTTLPLIMFAAGIVFYNYQQDRKDATQRVLETVRSIRLVLDSEVQRMTGGAAGAVADQRAAQRRFRRLPPHRARAFSTNMARTAWCWSRTASGRQLFSSVTTDTASLPLRNNRDIVEKVFATKRPQYSNLFVGVVKKRLIVTVEVPVMRDGEVLYVISFSPPIDIFQAIIEKQRPSQDWTISIFDGEGINFARVPNPQETIGKQASPTLLCRDVPQDRKRPLPTVSLEGVPLITSVARSSLTGWTVAGGIAEGSLVGPLWRNLAIASVIGGILLLVGLAFAVRMATTIARGEMLHDLLIEELNHRVKNTLAILQSIATQTFRSASRAEREKFEGRLGALAEAHNLLSTEKWQGSDLAEVIGRVLQPYLLNNPERVRMFGPSGAAVAAPCGGAVDDPARDRDQRREIRRAVQRHRHRGAGLGDHRGKHRPQAAADLDRGRRPPGDGAGAAGIRIAADRAQRARPARRRGHRGFPAPRRGLHRDLRARRERVAYFTTLNNGGRRRR